MNKPSLKIPIAKIGKWFHKNYGTVEFTQEDFDHIVGNFRANARGYEPYLRYGHNKKGAGIFSGEPAIGFLKEMQQLGDVLWGTFEPTTDEVVDEIRSGQYRYASAEVVRNATDKSTGKPLRIFLKGHTLTNEPFIPDLPRNGLADTQYLSEDGTESQFCILELADMQCCLNCGAEGETNQMGWCEPCALAAEEALNLWQNLN